MPFLGDLISDATGSKVPLSELLRRVKVLAARTKTPALGSWAQREIEGYSDETDLPPYRGPLDAQVFGDFSGPVGSYQRAVPIPQNVFPEEMQVPALFKIYVVHGVSELEAVILDRHEAKKSVIQLPWPAEVVNRVNRMTQNGRLSLVPMHGAETIYRQTTVFVLQGILDITRTRVLDLALELEAVSPDLLTDSEVTVTPAQVQYIYNTIVLEGGTAAVGTNPLVLQALATRPDTPEDLLARLKSIGVPDDLVGELGTSLQDDLTTEEPGDKVKGWLGKIAVLGAQAGGKIGGVVATEVVKKLVLSYFGM
jgi:hypothetical protein